MVKQSLLDQIKIGDILRVGWTYQNTQKIWKSGFVVFVVFKITKKYGNPKIPEIYEFLNDKTLTGHFTTYVGDAFYKIEILG